MISVIDNSVPFDIVNIIGEMVFDPKFTWQMPTGGFSTVSLDYDKEKSFKNQRVIDSAQLVHSLIIRDEIRCPLFHLFSILINYSLKYEFGKINDDFHIHRSKLNLMTRDLLPDPNKDYHNPPHVDPTFADDTDRHDISMLYYVNSSDGDTWFFNDELGFDVVKKVSPKQGRVVIFDAHHFHASSPPKNSTARVVLNVNLTCPYTLTEVYKYKEEEDKPRFGANYGSYKT